MPAGFEGNAKAMRDLQEATTAAEVKAVAHRFLNAEAKAPVLFDNVRLFDADKGVFVDNQAVLAQRRQNRRDRRRRVDQGARRTRRSSTARARHWFRASGTATCTSATIGTCWPTWPTA